MSDSPATGTAASTSTAKRTSEDHAASANAIRPPRADRHSRWTGHPAGSSGCDRLLRPIESTAVRLPILLALALVPAGGSAKGRASRAQRSHEVRREVKRQRPPPTLVLESVDLDAAQAVARVGGVSRAPAARMFSFHDVRDRHFIALEAGCEPEVSEVDTLRCRLELPRPYLKSQVLGMTLKVRGREISADGAEVVAKFALPPAGGAAASREPPAPRAAVARSDGQIPLPAPLPPASSRAPTPVPVEPSEDEEEEPTE